MVEDDGGRGLFDIVLLHLVLVHFFLVHFVLDQLALVRLDGGRWLRPRRAASVRDDADHLERERVFAGVEGLGEHVTMVGRSRLLLHCDGATAGLSQGTDDVVDVADADALSALQAVHRGAVALVRGDERCRVVFLKDRVYRV